MSAENTRNTIPIAWRTTAIDPGDGSGDCIIELPSELLDQLGWQVDDVLMINARRKGEIRIRKKAPKGV